MGHLIPVGRTFFAIGLIGMAIQHFIYQEFITGRAPAWPDSVPGGPIWAAVTGIAFIGVGISMFIGKGARHAAIAAAVVIFAWAFLRQIPIVLADSLFAGTWTMAGKALTLSGGALAVAGTLAIERGRDASPSSKITNLGDAFVLVSRICLGMFLVITGIQHFIFTEFVASLIPTWFPGDSTAWTYFAGVALIAGGIGINVPPTARLAALLSGLMVFSWFWIVHLPRTLTSVSDGIAVFEALAVAGIAFVVAGHLSQRKSGRQDRPPTRFEAPRSGTEVSALSRH